jgi:hypothetical protein
LAIRAIAILMWAGLGLSVGVGQILLVPVAVLVAFVLARPLSNAYRRVWRLPINPVQLALLVLVVGFLLAALVDR